MEATPISTNLLIQYIIVGAILLAASVWIILKLIKIRKQGPRSCCGCALSQTCNINSGKAVSGSKNCVSNNEQSQKEIKLKSHENNKDME